MSSNQCGVYNELPLTQIASVDDTFVVDEIDNVLDGIVKYRLRCSITLQSMLDSLESLLQGHLVELHTGHQVEQPIWVCLVIVQHDIMFFFLIHLL